MVTGWVLMKTTDKNKIDYKLQAFYLVVVVIFHVLFICGYYLKLNLMLDFGLAGLFINQLGICNYTLIGRGIAAVNSKNSAILIGIYTICGSTAVILMNGVGGVLFKYSPMLPWLVLSLPLATIVCLIVLFNLVCCNNESSEATESSEELGQVEFRDDISQTSSVLAASRGKH